MSIKHSDGIISFSIFDKFPELICFFSTRKLGNLNVGKLPLSNAKKMLNFFNIDLIDFAAMNQIHGNIISQVDKSNKGKLFLKTDGLITQDKNLFLGVKTADCVPLFFCQVKNLCVICPTVDSQFSKKNFCCFLLKTLKTTGDISCRNPSEHF